MKYVSAHLFYENLNFILRNGVFPFIEMVKRAQMIESYFFIRYSEGGTHIRLRMLTSETEKLKAFTETYFNKFLIEKPSIRTSKGENFYPNNSIQFIEYQPEIERYGGTELIKVAEQHFYHSSELTRAIITINTFEHYNIDLFDFAMQLQCMMLRSFGFSMEEGHQFFSRYYESWSRLIDESFFSTAYFLRVKDALENTSIKNEMRELWLEIEKDVEFEEDFLKDWFHHNQLIAKDLVLVEKSKKWQIIDSLIHMTNNRLGVSNFNEITLAYILKHSFE